jgi:tRNA(Ile)-lysidine synthase
MLRQLKSDKRGKAIQIDWSGWQLRYHRKRLWLLRPGSTEVCRKVDWSRAGALNLGPAIGELDICGLRKPWPDGLSIRPRTGGESIRIKGHDQHKKIKHVFQELDVPPWLRPVVPLLWWDEELAAVGDWFLSSRLQQFLSEHKTSLRWQPKDSAIRYLREACRPNQTEVASPEPGPN